MQEIVKYFKSDAGFNRVLTAMFEMYFKHGRAFGAVRLTRPGPEEENALSGFFKRDYYNQALIRIGLADFERQMKKNFPGDSEAELGAVLSEYIGKPAVEKKKPSAFGAVILSEILPGFASTPAEEWLNAVSQQTRRTYRDISEQYFNDPEAAIKIMIKAAEALNKINEDLTLIPLAAFSDTLEFSGACGRLFLKALAYRFNRPEPVSLEDCIELHLRAGLLSYGTVSSVTVFGLSAKTHDGKEDSYYGQANVFTLENLSRFASVSAYGGKVYIVEDSYVFAKLCERLRGIKCTVVYPGNSRAAFLYLLKMFNAAETAMYYAGDLSYKGLETADRLYTDIGKNFIPWHYTHEDYNIVLSCGNKPLPDEKKNLALHNETLASLLSQMRKTGKTASSVPLVPIFYEEIKNNVQ